MQVAVSLKIKFAFVCLAGLSLAVPATAGETGSSVPVELFEQSVNRWSGAYIGVDLSVSGGGAEIEKGTGIKKFDLNQAAISPSGYIGYNFAPFDSSNNGGWMFGVEFALSLSGVNKRKNDAVLGTVKMKSNFLASTRLRAGYAWENVYLYTAAGLGFSDFKIEPAGNSGTDIIAGITYGLGAEYAISDNWSARLEANMYDFGERSIRFNGTKRKIDSGMGQLKLGVSYRF